MAAKPKTAVAAATGTEDAQGRPALSPAMGGIEGFEEF